MSDLAEDDNSTSEKYSHGRVRKFFANLGPGSARIWAEWLKQPR